MDSKDRNPYGSLIGRLVSLREQADDLPSEFRSDLDKLIADAQTAQAQVDTEYRRAEQDRATMQRRLAKTRGVVRVLQKETVESEHARSDLLLQNRTLTKENLGLRVQANVDPLTSLYKRDFFKRGLMDAVKKARNSTEWIERDHVYLAVGYMDVNDFKLANDRAGHHVGDTVLSDIAYQIRNSLRLSREDLVSRVMEKGEPEHPHYIGREGGDEFALLMVMNGKKDLSQIKQDVYRKGREINERIYDKVSYEHKGEHVHMKTSIGFSIYVPWSHEDMGVDQLVKRYLNEDPIPMTRTSEDLSAELLEHADQLMYEAKEMKKRPDYGKGSTVVKIYGRE